METLKNKINHLAQLIQNGKAMEGFELYYDDEVVMQENELTPTIGKIANRQRETAFFNSLTTRFNATPVHLAVGEDVTMVVWHFDYIHKDWGKRDYQQVSVQHWKNGKIVKEEFFYGS
jgi:ketosteroid isomerase-like protein